jgi:hypothetical protein
MKETKYHIYLNNKCVNYNLSEDEFNKIWNDYLHMASIHKNLNREDLSYEEVVFDKSTYSLQGTIY